MLVGCRVMKELMGECITNPGLKWREMSYFSKMDSKNIHIFLTFRIHGNLREDFISDYNVSSRTAI